MRNYLLTAEYLLVSILVACFCSGCQTNKQIGTSKPNLGVVFYYWAENSDFSVLVYNQTMDDVIVEIPNVVGDLECALFYNDKNGFLQDISSGANPKFTESSFVLLRHGGKHGAQLSSSQSKWFSVANTNSIRREQLHRIEVYLRSCPLRLLKGISDISGFEKVFTTDIYHATFSGTNKVVSLTKAE